MASSLCLNSPSSSSSLNPLSWFENNSNNLILKDNDQNDKVEEKILEENCRFEGYDKLGINDMKLKKRPGRLVVPEYYYPKLDFDEKDRKIMEKKEIEIKGKNFCLVSKKGRREIMEDRFGFIIDILGDSKQAFFAVIDGHGGKEAADYVAENLGKNIVKAIENVTNNNNKEDYYCQIEQAIVGGYLLTDQQFLSQGRSSGACAASVVLKDGELHVANVGDCRVIMSKNGLAHVLTTDHRPSREDERLRIQNSGGFVDCRNGIWRVEGSLAISRAIGDLHLKQWIISQPDIKSFSLFSDFDFLILASDGLWDKINEQEAVDVVLRSSNSEEACKKLVELSFSRKNLDDITVMLIDLHNFL